MDILAIILGILCLVLKNKVLSIVCVIISLLGFFLYLILFSAKEKKRKVGTLVAYIVGIICSVIGICLF